MMERGSKKKPHQESFKVCDCEHMQYQHDFLGCAECPCAMFRDDR